MSDLFFITHPEVVIDPGVPVPRWGLSALGRDRMRHFAGRAKLEGMTGLYASDERKALDGADVLAERFGLPVRVDEDLRENDRSATGYVAPPEFWEIVREFFARPDASVRGWEKAADAQRRILGAVERIARRDAAAGDVVVVSHGGVGCLLMAHLRGAPISQEFSQPHPGGGCFFVIDRLRMTLKSGWRVLEDG